MTITAEQIPDEVVEAGAKARWNMKRARGSALGPYFPLKTWEELSEAKLRELISEERAALVAALAAWPRQREDYDLGEWSLILPLQQ